NNKYFTVERSSDGKGFKELLTQYSKAPNGNSTTRLDYKLVDTAPLSGTSYYRLKQTDYNGKSKTFNIVSVSFNQGGVTFIVRPNPNQGQFTIDFTGVENNHEVQILLYDQNGNEVYSNSFYSQDLFNSVDIVPDGKIGKGTYYCTMIVEGIKYTTKVLVE
ncbi:MAG TPA: T9SS type A sorting domain-containing protein, partial [Bacteroidia bacterium]|nr:T9SS type A sorting domain-containing protein [Bacteroidia bacterium]